MFITKVTFFVWLAVIMFFSVTSKKKFGFWINHYALTNFFYAFSLFLSIFGDFYVRPVSYEVYLIFFIGSLFFNLTLLTSNLRPLDISRVKCEYNLKKRRILEILVLAAILPLAYENFKLISSGVELWLLNQGYWESRNEHSFLLEFYRQNFIEPLTTVLMSTCFFQKYSDKSKYSSAINIFIGFVFALATMLMTGGGRAGVATFGYIVFLSYVASYYLRSSDIVYKINIKLIVVLFACVLLAISYASVGRGHTESIVDVLGERYALSPALFEAYYKNTDYCDGYTLGLSMFETPISFLLFPFKILGLDVNFERISGIVQEFRYAPAIGQETNAYVSPYLYYMRDFGIFGVALGPFIVGKIYNLIWNLCAKDSFLLLFYFVGIGMTCLGTAYPFRRGFMFVVVFAFLYKKITMSKE